MVFLLSGNYIVIVSRLGIIPLSFLQVAAGAGGSGEDTCWSETTSPAPRAGLNGGEGPWQRGEFTSILNVWVSDAHAHSLD